MANSFSNSGVSNSGVTNSSFLAEPDLGYGQLFGVLVRRRWWLISGLLLGLLLGGVAGYRDQKIYTSSLQLLVEPNYRSRNPAESGAALTDNQVGVDVGTQIQLLQTGKLIQRAMKTLQPQYPDLNPADPRGVNNFRRSLKVGQVASGDKEKSVTKIFQVAYTDNDPYKAKAIVEALQKVYQDYNLEQQRDRLNKGLEFVNKELPNTMQKVKNAESLLQQFRLDQQTVDPVSQALALEGLITKITQEEQVSRSQLQELQTRYYDLQQRVGMSPQQALLASRLTQSTRYQSYLNEIQKTELGLAQQRLRFQSGTPEIEQINELRQQQVGLLQAEVSRVVGSSSGDAAALGAGQLGALDLTLITQLVSTQVELGSAVARYQNLLTEEQKLRTELKRFPQLLAVYNRLLPEIELNRGTLKELLKAQQDIALEISRGGYDWQVVEEPQVGLSADSSIARFLMLGGVAGLMVGGMIAFSREAIDDAVHSSEDLQKQVTLPLLGMVPARMAASNSALPFGKPPAIVNLETAALLGWQPFRDAVDLLYQNIQLLHPNGVLKSLVVTSALLGEGKSTLSMGLAISAARLNRRVLLIDADLRRPSLHAKLNLPNEHGLSSLLRSNTPIETLVAAQIAANRSNLAIITAGPTSGDPAMLLSSPRMQALISQFEQHYDLILIDAPPVLGMVDAVLASACADGTLLVGRLDQVTRAELSQAMSVLKPLNVIGVVANGADVPGLEARYPPISTPAPIPAPVNV
jgi:polysaccharide biosynthesis transport protein